LSISFDPRKNERNIAARGLSFELVEALGLIVGRHQSAQG
jgi:uncharacterized DUF497 family protein